MEQEGGERPECDARWDKVGVVTREDLKYCIYIEVKNEASVGRMS